MAIEFTCPHCQVKTLVEEEFAGQSGPCYSCGKTVVVPPASGRCEPLQRAAIPIQSNASIMYPLGVDVSRFGPLANTVFLPHRDIQQVQIDPGEG